MANLSRASRREARTNAPAVEAIVASPPEATGMLHSLEMYRPFRLLFSGTLATNSAFWMYQIAVGWLALQTTDSPFFVGLTGFAGGIPLLFLALPAGVVIDRVDRRTVLMAAQVGVMTVAGLFALLVGTGLIRPWSILLLAFLYGVVMSFVFPTRNAIVPDLVDRTHLANAVALNAAGQNATRVVGPSLAGLLIALIGISGTFAIAAAMQILALYWTSQLPANGPAATSGGSTLWTSLMVGLRVVAKDPFLVGLILLASATTVLIMPYINLMPVFARDVMGLGSAGLGVLMASSGLGSVTGALAVARYRRLATWPGIQLITAGGFAGLVLLFAVTPSVLMATVLLFVAGLMSAAYMAINQTVLQLKCDDDVRGRVLSIYLLTWGMLPLGQLPLGALADRIGASAATAIACTIALGVITLLALRFPSLRS
ncbi:MAG TPA: MFS transporter [Thermomicrobiales bacterium]|nr:MFS transporter [Thermomicrobiales bacterium]